MSVWKPELHGTPPTNFMAMVNLLKNRFGSFMRTPTWESPTLRTKTVDEFPLKNKNFPPAMFDGQRPESVIRRHVFKKYSFQFISFHWWNGEPFVNPMKTIENYFFHVSSIDLCEFLQVNTQYCKQSVTRPDPMPTSGWSNPQLGPCLIHNLTPPGGSRCCQPHKKWLRWAISSWCEEKCINHIFRTKQHNIDASCKQHFRFISGKSSVVGKNLNSRYI